MWLPSVLAHRGMLAQEGGYMEYWNATWPAAFQVGHPHWCDACFAHYFRSYSPVDFFARITMSGLSVVGWMVQQGTGAPTMGRSAVGSRLALETISVGSNMAWAVSA